MTKFEFTPLGVAAMCQHFQHLDDAALAKASSALNDDFKAWVTNYFELSESQVLYLNTINDQVIDFMASNAAFALRNRLPIVLLKPEFAAKRDSKVTKPSSSLTAEVLPDGNYEASGEFQVEITY